MCLVMGNRNFFFTVLILWLSVGLASAILHSETEKAYTLCLYFSMEKRRRIRLGMMQTEQEPLRWQRLPKDTCWSTELSITLKILKTTHKPDNFYGVEKKATAVVKGHCCWWKSWWNMEFSVCAYLISLSLYLLLSANTTLQSYSKLVLNIKCILRSFLCPWAQCHFEDIVS